MNRKYCVVDGHAMIFDDDNKYISTYNYNDSLEERLIVENQIEYLENGINECAAFLKFKNDKRNKNSELLKTIFGLSIPVVFLLNLVLSIRFGSPLHSISTISNIVNNFVLIATPATLITFGLVEKIVLGKTKVEKSIISKKKIAENEVQKLNKKLCDMSLENYWIDEPNLESNLVDDREAIKRIEQICSLKEFYSNQRKRLQKMARNGVLNSYLYSQGFKDSEVLASIEDDVLADAQILSYSKKNNK